LKICTKIQDRIPKHDVIILLGDINAKIGLEDAYSSVTGKSNSNGELICEYAAANMYIHYEHKIQTQKKYTKERG
jgi:hypothetical protein